MKLKILFIALAILTNNYLFSAKESSYLQEQTRQITQNIGQEHFPADISGIIAGYAAPDPLKIFRKNGEATYFIYPSKTKEVFESAWKKSTDSLEIQYNPNVKKGTYIDVILIPEDKVVENWIALGIAIAYKLGVRKFVIAKGYLGSPPNKLYYASEQLSPADVVGRKKITSEELINYFKRAEFLQKQLNDKGQQLIIKTLHDTDIDNVILDLSVPKELVKQKD